MTLARSHPNVHARPSGLDRVYIPRTYAESLTYKGYTDRAACGFPSESEVVDNYVRVCETLRTRVLEFETTEVDMKLHHRVAESLWELYIGFYRRHCRTYPSNVKTDDFKRKQFQKMTSIRVDQWHREIEAFDDYTGVRNSIQKKLAREFPRRNFQHLRAVLDSFASCFWTMMFFPPLIKLRFVESGSTFDPEVMVFAASTPVTSQGAPVKMQTLYPGLVTTGRCLVKAVVSVGETAAPQPGRHLLPVKNRTPLIATRPDAVVYTEYVCALFVLPPNVFTFGRLSPEHVYEIPLVPFRQTTVIVLAEYPSRYNAPTATSRSNSEKYIQPLVDGQNKRVYILGVFGHGYDMGFKAHIEPRWQAAFPNGNVSSGLENVKTETNRNVANPYGNFRDDDNRRTVRTTFTSLGKFVAESVQAERGPV